MRAEFAQAMLALFGARRDLVFITGDLGYMALEDVAKAYGESFINAGVAEQNAVSLAAGLARVGQLPWVYSSAPFVVLRPYEQIRNDVCLHRLPVKLVGNAGGYGHGIMGATHHALEDLGAMRVLPNLRIYVPLTAADVDEVVRMMAEDPLPNYLRLNSPAQLPEEIPAFAPWRRIKRGRRCVVVGVGPVLGNLYEIGDQDLLDDMEIWSVGVLPIDDMPADLATSIREKRRVVTIELPHGIAIIIALILFFGGVNLLAIAILGEYVIKIFDESKGRPKFIRKAIRRGGQHLTSATELETFVQSQNRR